MCRFSPSTSVPQYLPKTCATHSCRTLVTDGGRFCFDCRKTHSAAVEEIRNRKEPWRAWYHRWPWTGKAGLKVKVLALQPVCMKCHRNPSTVVDHIVPHKGLWVLFVDLTNLQGLCKECHDQKTAEEVNAAKEVTKLGPYVGVVR